MDPEAAKEGQHDSPALAPRGIAPPCVEQDRAAGWGVDHSRVGLTYVEERHPQHGRRPQGLAKTQAADDRRAAQDEDGSDNPCSTGQSHRCGLPANPMATEAIAA
jgi:hypothetical protein